MKALQVITLMILAVLTIGSLLLAAVSVVYLIRAIEPLTDVGRLFDEIYNQHTEAGIAYPALRADDPLLQTRRVLITEEINERTAKGVVERLFYLDALDRAAPIDLFISTQGGWSDSAFTIIDAMRAINAPVNTHAIGGCYSAGALILTAATGQRSATANAVISVHISGDASDEEYTMAPLLQRREERLFRSTARVPEAWYPMVGADRYYYLSPEQALELGLIDAIEHGAGAERPSLREAVAQ